MGCTSSSHKVLRPAHAPHAAQPAELTEAEPTSPLITVVVPPSSGADAGGAPPHAFHFQSRRNSVAANSVTTPFLPGGANSTFFYPDSPQFGPRNHTMSPTGLGAGGSADPARYAAAAAAAAGGRAGGSMTPPTGDSVVGWRGPRGRRESTYSGGGFGDGSIAAAPDEVRLSMTELARHNNALRNSSAEPPGETYDDASPPHSSSGGPDGDGAGGEDAAGGGASNGVVVDGAGDSAGAGGKSPTVGVSPRPLDETAMMHAATTDEYAAPLVRDSTLTFASPSAAAAAAACAMMSRAPTSSGSAGGLTTKTMLVRSWLSASLEATDPADDALGHSPTSSAEQGDGSFRVEASAEAALAPA